jgi:hypothetical protein
MAVIEAIQTTYLENNDVQIVTFASIPATYEHLQLRVSTHDLYAADVGELLIRLNNDSGSNYSNHSMKGASSTASADASTGNGYGEWGDAVAANNPVAFYSNSIIDILDYANTNKNTTVQYSSGSAATSTPIVRFGSSLWDNPDAVTEIDVYVINTPRFQRGSEFTLYGIQE